MLSYSAHWSNLEGGGWASGSSTSSISARSASASGQSKRSRAIPKRVGSRWVVESRNSLSRGAGKGNIDSVKQHAADE